MRMKYETSVQSSYTMNRKQITNSREITDPFQLLHNNLKILNTLPEGYPINKMKYKQVFLLRKSYLDMTRSITDIEF